MIDFACRCGHRMQVDDDQAGSDLQCPRCGILNTVPTLSDLGQVAADGTYQIDDDGNMVLSPDDRLRSLHRAFTRNTTGADGSEIDNRVTFDELAVAGDIPFADETERPKYDPVTGELVRPLAIKNDPGRPGGNDGDDADDIPMAKAAITYAAATPRSTNLTSAVVLLSSPGNMVVLGIVFILHVALQGIAALTMVFFFVGILAIPLAFGLFGHFANVVDEIGPRDMDELPRPLRDLQISEDLWQPFVHVALALAVCFGPSYVVLTRMNLPIVAVFPSLVATLFMGAIAFPGVFLTTTTSGSVLNLRPDRVLSVARANGPVYLGLIFLGVFALGSYVVGNLGVLLLMGSKPPTGGFPIWINGFVSYPLMGLGIYLMHLYCWRLGLYYRQHHATFDWVFQRHERKNRPTEDATIRAARRVAQRQAAMARRSGGASTWR